MNLYNPTPLAQQVVFSATNLPAGSHTIKIVTTSSIPGLIDAFRVHGTGPILKIACVGDSITYGSSTLGDNSWPSQMARMMGTTNYTVNNYGIPGATMLKNGDAPYWGSWALENATNFLPDIVVIALGANDSKPQNWAYSNQFVGDFESMITIFQTLPSHPKVYVSTCFTVQGAGAFGITDPVVTGDVVPAQKQAALATGCQVIDLNAASKNLPASDYIDGVHPTDSGALLIAQTEYTGLTGLTPPPPAPPGVPTNLSGSPDDAQVTLGAGRGSMGWRLIM